MSEPDYVTAARAVYDASADRYVESVWTEVRAATEAPVDRGLLSAFVELVQPRRGARVADVGCGPGRVAAYLARHGLDVIGIDVAPAMLVLARRAHPAIRFEEGRLDELPLADASVDAVVCWYSIICTPPEHLDDAFREIARVLVPGGHVLLGFHAGTGEAFHRPDAFESGLPLTSYRHAPDDVARRLTAAGLAVRSRTVREPELDHESTSQAFLIARASNMRQRARHTRAR